MVILNFKNFRIDIKKPDLKKPNFKKILPNNFNKGWILFLFIAVLSANLFNFNIEKYKEAKNIHEQTEMQAKNISYKASKYLQTKQQLDLAKDELKTAKQRYASSIDSGLFFEIVSKSAKENKIEDISFKNNGEETVCDGVIKTISFDMQLSGDFPGVYKVLHSMEFSQLPIEVKPISIQTESNNVTTVKTAAVLYSLNEPEYIEYVVGKSGKYDPFFDPMEIDDSDDILIK